MVSDQKSLEKEGKMGLIESLTVSSVDIEGVWTQIPDADIEPLVILRLPVQKTENNYAS